MINTRLVQLGLPTILLALLSLPAAAQSFRVQCPSSTVTHPDPNNTGVNSAEHPYVGPTKLTPGANGYLVPDVPSSNAPVTANGAIKCQQIGGGDGYATMADGTQTYMFSFGPLSGLAHIAAGKPGTVFPEEFNRVYSGVFKPGDPATTDGANDYNADPTLGLSAYVQGDPLFKYNGAVGLTPNHDCLADNAATAAANAALPAGSTPTPLPCPNTPTPGVNFKATAGTAESGVYAGIDGHVDPRQILDVGVMNGNIPAPLMAIDEDDEFFLTLSNVGMIMRPDLFEQHTVHFHGYPNASSLYDGVPDASVAINIGGSFTYYYLAPDAGTYFWHCHITPPEHLQMGMVGQIYVRPRQNRVPHGTTLYAGLQAQQADLRTACTSADILCSNPLPSDLGTLSGNTKATVAKAGVKYAYNDGDGMSAYEVEYPLQIHGFDPNFHFVGMTFNPEAFEDMKDKYFLLNGRSYPDTVVPGPMATQASDSRSHYSQPLPSIINIPAGKRALLRISDLDVTEYQTLASLGIPMHVVGFNAKLLRDQSGNNMDYYTNSITLAGGESLDVILDASDQTKYPAGSVYYLYTPNLDHLSNDAENFGGLMTEVHIN
ncbi:MAG TPA: multicopper oxidase domain-containing protein [Steroidobacteraceae bacterium]|nr:multicopper oxidase domain-containing protein [Steroidobacteraceae bacterium]